MCCCCLALQCTEGSDAPLSPAEICIHIQGAGSTKPAERKEGRHEQEMSEGCAGFVSMQSTKKPHGKDMAVL